MNFRSQYDQRRAFIDAIVQRKIGELSCPSEALLSAIGYSVGTGGKRLRAILALEFFCAIGATDCKFEVSKELECVLAAIEILHLYTLVHDDLPCMDNDDFRRGKPSCHKVYGEAMALLCGDSLLNLAYELLFEGARVSANKELYIEACSVFSSLVGLRGVIGGQALEFESLGNQSQQNAMTIYRHKTCDLIVAAIQIGAILAGADEVTRDTLERFGYHFGIAFQIRDDLLDASQKGSIEKNSLPSLIGEQNANNILEQSINSALQILDSLKIGSSFLHELTKFAASRTT